MTFGHKVKYNGKWYMPGEKIAEVEKSASSFSENTNLSVEKSYKKTEINRMSTAELQELALENNVDGADEMTGAELKKVLIEKFGL